MDEKEKTLRILSILKMQYPNVKCALDYTRPHELLIATRLSAQCTDKRVNMVTPALFDKYRSIGEFAAADISDVEECIKTCGLYKTKAKDIVLMCRTLHEEYNDIIPDSIDELTKLSGVGRKTANLICGDLYGQKGAVVADTHVIRLSNRLGLCDTKDAGKVETKLRSLLPEDESLNFCHRLVWHGRQVCDARKPECDGCVLNQLCYYAKA